MLWDCFFSIKYINIIIICLSLEIALLNVVKLWFLFCDKHLKFNDNMSLIVVCTWTILTKELIWGWLLLFLLEEFIFTASFYFIWYCWSAYIDASSCLQAFLFCVLHSKSNDKPLINVSSILVRNLIPGLLALSLLQMEILTSHWYFGQEAALRKVRSNTWRMNTYV